MSDINWHRFGPTGSAGKEAKAKALAAKSRPLPAHAKQVATPPDELSGGRSSSRGRSAESKRIASSDPTSSGGTESASVAASPKDVAMTDVASVAPEEEIKGFEGLPNINPLIPDALYSGSRSPSPSMINKDISTVTDCCFVCNQLVCICPPQQQATSQAASSSVEVTDSQPMTGLHIPVSQEIAHEYGEMVFEPAILEQAVADIGTAGQKVIRDFFIMLEKNFPSWVRKDATSISSTPGSVTPMLSNMETQQDLATDQAVSEKGTEVLSTSSEDEDSNITFKCEMCQTAVPFSSKDEKRAHRCKNTDCRRVVCDNCSIIPEDSSGIYCLRCNPTGPICEGALSMENEGHLLQAYLGMTGTDRFLDWDDGEVRLVSSGMSEILGYKQPWSCFPVNAKCPRLIGMNLDEGLVELCHGTHLRCVPTILMKGKIGCGRRQGCLKDMKIPAWVQKKFGILGTYLNSSKDPAQCSAFSTPSSLTQTTDEKSVKFQVIVVFKTFPEDMMVHHKVHGTEPPKVLLHPDSRQQITHIMIRTYLPEVDWPEKEYKGGNTLPPDVSSGEENIFQAINFAGRMLTGNKNHDAVMSTSEDILADQIDKELEHLSLRVKAKCTELSDRRWQHVADRKRAYRHRRSARKWDAWEKAEAEETEKTLDKALSDNTLVDSVTFNELEDIQVNIVPEQVWEPTMYLYHAKDQEAVSSFTITEAEFTRAFMKNIAFWYCKCVADENYKYTIPLIERYTLNPGSNLSQPLQLSLANPRASSDESSDTACKTQFKAHSYTVAQCKGCGMTPMQMIKERQQFIINQCLPHARAHLRAIESGLTAEEKDKIKDSIEEILNQDEPDVASGDDDKDSTDAVVPPLDIKERQLMIFSELDCYSGLEEQGWSTIDLTIRQVYDLIEDVCISFNTSIMTRVKKGELSFQTSMSYVDSKKPPEMDEEDWIEPKARTFFSYVTLLIGCHPDMTSYKLRRYLEFFFSLTDDTQHLVDDIVQTFHDSLIEMCIQSEQLPFDQKFEHMKEEMIGNQYNNILTTWRQLPLEEHYRVHKATFQKTIAPDKVLKHGHLGSLFYGTELDTSQGDRDFNYMQRHLSLSDRLQFQQLLISIANRLTDTMHEANRSLLSELKDQRSNELFDRKDFHASWQSNKLPVITRRLGVIQWDNLKPDSDVSYWRDVISSMVGRFAPQLVEHLTFAAFEKDQCSYRELYALLIKLTGLMDSFSKIADEQSVRHARGPSTLWMKNQCRACLRMGHIAEKCPYELSATAKITLDEAERLISEPSKKKLRGNLHRARQAETSQQQREQQRESRRAVLTDNPGKSKDQKFEERKKNMYLDDDGVWKPRVPCYFHGAKRDPRQLPFKIPGTDEIACTPSTRCMGLFDGRQQMCPVIPERKALYDQQNDQEESAKRDKERLKHDQRWRNQQKGSQKGKGKSKSKSSKTSDEVSDVWWPANKGKGKPSSSSRSESGSSRPVDRDAPTLGKAKGKQQHGTWWTPTMRHERSGRFNVWYNDNSGQRGRDAD